MSTVADYEQNVTSRRRARFGTAAAAITLALVLLVDARGVFAQRSGDVKSSEPLRLSVALSKTEIQIHERLTVDLKLTNTSARAVGGCVRAWEDWMIVGTAGTHSGRKWVDDGFPPEHLFLLPPGHTLSWQVTIDLARLQAGKAQLMAFFFSDCFPGTSLGRGVLMWRGHLASSATFSIPTSTSVPPAAVVCPPPWGDSVVRGVDRVDP